MDKSLDDLKKELEKTENKISSQNNLGKSGLVIIATCPTK